MVPEKKTIDSTRESVLTSEETLEQTALQENQLDDENSIEINENSTVLTKNNGMITDKKAVSVSVRRIRALVALGVAIVVLVAGIITVNLLPEDEEESTSASTSISMTNVSTDDVKRIEVTSDKGTLAFVSEITESESDTSSGATSTVVWSLEGYDNNLISSSAVNAAADSVSSIYANRIMAENQDDKAEYGLDKPSITAKVTLRDGGGFTIDIGNIAPDGSGYYATVSDDEKIYLVSAGTVGNFNTTPEALADTVIVTAPTVDDVEKKSDKKYYNEDDGSLETFESIEISGPKYGQTAVITPIDDNEFVEYSIDLGTYSRYADADVVTELFGIMTDGLVAIDTYALEPTDAEIKKYGLDTPELNINIKYGTLSTSLKAKMYDKENDYYAVMIGGRDAIYAVTADALSMLEYGLTDYYYQFVFQEFIYEFKNITVNTPDKTYTFDIEHDSSNDTFTAESNGKTVDDSLLSAYYQYYLTLSPEVKSSYTDGKAELTATFTYKKASKGKRVIELVKQTERRYLLKIDGNAMGIVNSTDFDYLVVYAQYVMDNKGIPDPS